MIAFTVYGKPEPAGSKKAVPVGPRCSHGRASRWAVVDANSKAKKWKAAVSKAAEWAMQGREMLSGPLELRLTFYLERPNSHFTRSGALSAAGRRRGYPRVRPDVLKLSRGAEDALTGIVYGDDAQIVREPIAKLYGTPTRAEIEVIEVTDEPPPYSNELEI